MVSLLEESSQANLILLRYNNNKVSTFLPIDSLKMFNHLFVVMRDDFVWLF